MGSTGFSVICCFSSFSPPPPPDHLKGLLFDSAVLDDDAAAVDVVVMGVSLLRLSSLKRLRYIHDFDDFSLNVLFLKKSVRQSKSDSKMG